MISKHPKCWNCGREMIPARSPTGRCSQDYGWMCPRCDLGVEEDEE